MSAKTPSTDLMGDDDLTQGQVSRRQRAQAALAKGDTLSAFEAMDQHVAITEMLLARLVARTEHIDEQIAGVERKADERHKAVYEVLGGIVTRLDRIERARRNSASEIDAQALGEQIERVDRKHDGTALAIATAFTSLDKRINAVDLAIGHPPDRTMGIKGRGLRGSMAKFEGWRAAVLLLVAGAAASGGHELVKWLMHAMGGV